MSGPDQHKFTVNVGLYTRSVEITGSAEADSWYNSTEGRVKLQVESPDTIAIAGPHGTHQLIHGTGPDDTWYFVDSQGIRIVNGGLLTNGRAYAQPFWPGRKCTLNNLIVQNNSAGLGAGTRDFRMALYEADHVTRMPANLVADYGVQTGGESSGDQPVWTMTQALQPIGYFVVIVLQSALATQLMRNTRALRTVVPEIAASPTYPGGNTAAMNSFYSDTGFAGAFPATFGAVAGSAFGPLIAANLSQ
jgi:hypothetical protein